MLLVASASLSRITPNMDLSKWRQQGVFQFPTAVFRAFTDQQGSSKLSQSRSKTGALDSHRQTALDGRRPTSVTLVTHLLFQCGNDLTWFFQIRRWSRLTTNLKVGYLFWTLLLDRTCGTWQEALEDSVFQCSLRSFFARLKLKYLRCRIVYVLARAY